MLRLKGTFHELSIDGERVAAFIPATLPTGERTFGLGHRAIEMLERADQSLGRLDAVLGAGPSLEWLVHGLMCKEAVASTRLAGGNATLDDLFAHEAGVRLADATGADEAGQARALLDALSQAREELGRGSAGLTISARYLNRAHRRLMEGAAQIRAPGHLRSIPTWIGGTSPGNAAYVPPPPFEVGHSLEQLDEFMRLGTAHRLVRIGLFQAQFENIRPYLDGNGRLVRMLVALLLEYWRFIPAPVLCLSDYFERRRADHDRFLTALRTDGDLESWVAFFLEGVATAAEDGVDIVRSLVGQVMADRERVLQSSRASVAGLRLFEQLMRHPMVTVPSIVKLLETTPPTAAKAVALLEDLQILKEVSGRKRDRAFSYTEYFALLCSEAK